MRNAVQREQKGTMYTLAHILRVIIIIIYSHNIKTRFKAKAKYIYTHNKYDIDQSEYQSNNRLL